MGIVRLGPADYERVVALWQRAGLSFRPDGRDTRDAFARQLESGVQVVLGLEREGELLGVVVVSHDSRKGWINRLAVEPAYRRQGIGSRLIAAAEEYLKEEGIQVYAALIIETNETSIAAFAQAGYSHSPEVLYLSKRISPDA